MGQGQALPCADVEGFQVTLVHPGSPAHAAGLVPYFDFIVHIDNLALKGGDPAFVTEYVQRNDGQSVRLQVFNLLVRDLREVCLTPSSSWGGAGLLGCSIAWQNAGIASQAVVHVVGVAPGSPAERAGIAAGRDYVVGLEGPLNREGTPYPRVALFSEAQDFTVRMEDRLRRRRARDTVVVLLVYDCCEQALREVSVPIGLAPGLGMDLATGFIHSIPFTGDGTLPVLTQFAADPAAAAAPVQPTAAATAAGQSASPRRAEQQQQQQPQPPAPPPPPPLPPGWVAAVDPNSGCTYYANPETGESAWEPPSLR
eukprot:TRINITY_DN24377_c3_g1_i1.p1 TRINITY_DN24377_c3_g1~~TRINITY_DN24377_c3_g1_i1.p1  ORF type:complete len:349 (+),score=99.77 TRINITY_DN24377_c3_g1_i1:114-1049(+)